jgi:hypothetical protein
MDLQELVFTMANAFPVAEVAQLEVFGKAGLNLGN